MKILHHISLLWFTCHFHRSVENEMLINDYLVNYHKSKEGKKERRENVFECDSSHNQQIVQHAL